jgi:hypothetical protein
MSVERVTETSAAKPGAPPGNPHVLWRQLTGLVLWVAVISYFAGGLVSAVIGLALGGVTFADAWMSGIYKDASRKAFLNMSPMAWGIVMAVLLIAAYPLYLLNRNKLRTRHAGNGFFIAIIVLGGLAIALLILNILMRMGAVV